MLQDSFGRDIDYIRIAVTDRCNLKCYYCMPASGIDYEPRSHLMSYEEIIRITDLLSKNGIQKIRITGGEPFLRKDIMLLLKSLSEIDGINKIAITTNGSFCSKYLDEIQELGINSINLSIDSLDKTRFNRISRTDQYDNVMHCLKLMIDKGFDLKLNCVVLKDQNIEDIIPLIQLSEHNKISIRFIEEMPFNGSGVYHQELEWDHYKILDHIRRHFGTIRELKNAPGSTSINYQIPGHAGSFGIIPAYTRSFCGSCNRIRLTPNGYLKTCLYGSGVFNIKDLMRAGATDQEIMTAVKDAVENKHKNGFEAEKQSSQNMRFMESMAKIGG